MTFWRKDIVAEPAETRADVIIQKKRRKQVPNAKGLGAVTIPRNGPRAVHQRNEDRHVLRGTKATADIAGEIHEVSILNLSSNGVMIAYEGDLRIGEQVYLTIEDCAPITTAVRWLRAGKVGLEFIAETVIIAEAGVQDFIVKTIRREAEAAGTAGTLKIGTEQRDASKRHPLVFMGKVRWDGGEATARLRNISASGAMVALADNTNLSKGDALTLSLVNAGAIPARIRWIVDRQFGLQFDQPFDVSLLVNENAAELAPPDDFGGLAAPSTADEPTEDDFDSLKIRLGNVRNPHCPPEMRYGKLTLDEVYATLYPDGVPEGLATQVSE
ncbi:PilZ domain-containing protein [Qipengyuania sp. 1NDH17]|uniref:PilZ domain-containing protein n=1 Tax=Qipengyuania polymorpha TaxID=2867234 RepID=A0ABS7IY45_9SPHN|nr:PilZ domain-containing protein [Qipengyuania polymorpha]MBX7457979.1 PilZ domain-containing protein [Qipengyuania polymorpha]